MRGGDAGVVELVTTNIDAHAMKFLFVWTEGDDKAVIGDFAAAWNRQRSYEVNGVSAGGNAGADTLVELAKVVGIDAGPDGLFWTAAEVMVFESLAGLGVIDGVGFDTLARERSG